MCGIAGIVGSRADEGLTWALLDHLAHRGPDGAGVHGWQTGSMGACRLWVRGEARVELPQMRAELPAVVAYNGEIYCRDPAALADMDTPLSPDAELDILLDALGAGQAADGMYAAATFFPQTGALRLDRDPLGIKPLFWRRTGDHRLAFASEVAALLHPALGSARLRPGAMVELMTFGRVLRERTLYDDIQTVPAGGTVRVLGDRIEVEPASCPPLAHFEPGAADLRTAVRAALSACLVSSRPLGLALSGGLDSSILAFELNDMGIEDLVTISVQVEGMSDGLRDLTELGLPSGGAWTTWRHRVIEVTPATYPKLVEEAVVALGTPTRMSSAPLYIALAQAAAEEGIVVLLTGEGPDELFGGYNSYLRWREQRGQRGPVADEDRALLDDLAAFACPPGRRHWIERLLPFTPMQESLDTFAQVYGPLVAHPPFEALRQMELSLSLEPLLLRADHCLMRHGIEGRTPFLHGIIPAIAATFDDEQLLVGDRTKVAFLRAWEGLLSPQRWSQPKKPFRAPLHTWLAGPLAPWCRSRLSEAAPQLADAGFDGKTIDELLHALATGQPESANLVYSILTVSEWLMHTPGS